MTWRQQAAEIIAEATRALPDDTPLPYRIETVDAARPQWGGCSWPRKAWQAARRDDCNLQNLFILIRSIKQICPSRSKVIYEKPSNSRRGSIFNDAEKQWRKMAEQI